MRSRKSKKQGERKLISRALLCAVLILISAVTAVAASSFIVTAVECDGKTVKVTSLSSDPYDIIELAGITVAGDDEVVLDKFDKSSVYNSISVVKAHDVVIQENKKKDVTVRVGGTVGDALKEAGITLGKYDSSSPGVSTLISNDITVKIIRAFKVTVEVDGKTKTYKASAGTVADLLKRENIELGEYDTLNCKKSAKLEKGMKIKICRVTYKDEIETQTVAYSLKKEYSDDMYIGQSKITQEGENGERIDYYMRKFVDGVQTERELVMSLETKAPVDRVIVYGTKRYSASVSPNAQVISELAPTVEIELDENGKPKNYKKLIVGKATAYCGGGITATGQKAMPGRVAVNPNQIPYGTKMYIVSSDGKYVYGYCEASDTGGFARKGSATVDLYMHSYNACVQFGRRYVEIYILE